MPSLPALYLITDRQQLPGGRQLPKVVEELLQAGVRMLQLREKDLSAAELYPLAQEMRELTRRYDCLLFINDRIDLALAVEADGVHLGGHSLPIPAARKLLGPNRLIGVSTHSLQEILLAAQQGADFATFGPVFFTPSKAAYGAPLGLNRLTQACAVSPIPIYALGGIKPENTGSVKRTGADGIALISALLCAESPAASCQRLFEVLDT
ncbi:MAG: thiamine phosphate synthase [Deltaproteobacteria bacterium]|nr:thiamine phosphate synthase [Deltaproteobacteria bacterium]